MRLNTNLSVLILIALLPLVSNHCLAGSSTTLSIYTENYPPYNMSLSGEAFAHSKEDITGVCTDIVVALLSHTDVDYRIKLRNWSLGLSRAEHKPNFALYCAAMTEDRAPYFKWVGPLAHINWTLFAKSGSEIKLQNLEDARSYKIGGYKGDVMTNYLIEKGFNLSVMTDGSVNPQRLEYGQIDLWVTDGLVGPYVASESNVSGLVPVLTFKSTPLYLAVNKDTEDDIVTKLNHAMELMVGSGESKAILESYIK